MVYLWNHEPVISSEPKEIIHHFLNEEDPASVFECGVFLLENSKFLFIRFSSFDKHDKNVGVTEVEEFDKLEEAVILFESCTK
jgi:hypothetical protein